MARAMETSLVALSIGVLFMTLVGQSYGQASGLKVGFYMQKCNATNVEVEVYNVVKAAYLKDPTVVAAMLRLFFHDCFVRGCDASLLLNGTNTEKTAGPNGSVRGYYLIDSCKTVLEQKCPGLVSCADIITIATRAAVSLAGGNWYNVETGRRDGVTSLASEAAAQLPSPRISVANALQQYGQRGLTTEQTVLVVLGGHSVGFTHCSNFLDRLYNYQNTGKPDPNMNTTMVANLRKTCPQSGVPNNLVNLDQTPGSGMIVDNGCFKADMVRQGVLQIDQQFGLDPATKAIVTNLAKTADFKTKFGPALVQFGRNGVLTGANGQIRKKCYAVNYSS